MQCGKRGENEIRKKESKIRYAGFSSMLIRIRLPLTRVIIKTLECGLLCRQ